MDIVQELLRFFWRSKFWWLTPHDSGAAAICRLGDIRSEFGHCAVYPYPVLKLSDFGSS